MTVMKRFTSKLPVRAGNKSVSPVTVNADFFIIHDPAAAQQAVQVLSELLSDEGYTVQTNAQEGYVRKQVGNCRVAILYLTSDALLNKEVASALKSAKSKGKQLMVVHETDEAAGAILKRRSRRTVDLAKMLNLDKSKVKGLSVTRSMPFRVNMSYAKYAALNLIRSVDLDTFPTTMRGLEVIKRQERVPQSRNWVYTRLVQWVTQGLDRTMMALVGRSDTGKSVISATLGDALSRPFRTIPYFFNELDHRSRNLHLCIEYFATRLSQIIPDFHRVNFRFQNATLLERFTYLILEPARAVKSPRVLCVVLVLDGIDQCLGNEAESIMHMMQTVKLPSWLKVMVTGKHSILAHGTENTTVIDLAESTDNVIDIAQFLERCFRTHMLSTPEEYREGVRLGTQASQGTFFI